MTSNAAVNASREATRSSSFRGGNQSGGGGGRVGDEGAASEGASTASRDSVDLQPPPSTVTTNSLPPQNPLYEQRLRRRLRFFLMNPYEKWKARRQFPFKLALQLAKIILVTTQLVLFGSLRTDHINYLQQSRTTLRHVFLQNWQAALDVLVYPPAAGPFSVYTQDAFLDSLSFSIRQYYLLDTVALTKFYRREPGPQLCFHRWMEASVHNDSSGAFVYDYDIHSLETCASLAPCKELLTNASDPRPPYKRMPDCFLRLNHSWPELTQRLAFYKFSLNFTLATVHVPPKSIADAVSCYTMDVELIWNDAEQSGQMQVELEVTAVELLEGQCSGTLTPSNRPLLTFVQILDFFVLLLCISSALLCTRALIKGYLLRKKVEAYLRGACGGASLSSEESGRFVNLWYCMILVNDAAISLGTMFKMSIDFSRFNEGVFTGTTVLLGVGTLLVWCGVLRYLGFFAYYNVLMQTMKRSAPNVLRFTVCAALLYFGFLLCGWIVLGPYSIKFKDVLSASECLFSLINGDDMFATFFTISDHNLAVKWFARVYLYVFISIFIYVVLSLFIAIILSAYDVVKEQYSGDLVQSGASELERFLSECPETPTTTGADSVDSLWTAAKEVARDVAGICCASLRRRQRNEYEEIGGAARLSDDSD